MRFSRLLFVVVVYLVSILFCLASAQNETWLQHNCSGDDYTSNSIYQQNLYSLFSSLVSDNGIKYGFSNISEGQGTDKVNAIALCRGDITQYECKSCVNFSTTDLPNRCPNRREGIVWYDHCMLRYSNKWIFHSWEKPVFYMWSLYNVSDVNLFTQQLDGLLSMLRKKASAGDSRVKFAIGDTNYANLTRIYGLVQCTPDLNQVQCSDCLNASFTDKPYLLLGRQGGRNIGPSCNFRYEIDPFYEIPSPPPPAIVPPLPNSTNIVPPTGRSDNVRKITISVVLIGFFAILIV